MKKLVPNPEFAKAPYELAMLNKDGKLMEHHTEAVAARSFTLPPDDVVQNWEKLIGWFRQHGVPSHIEVDV